MPDPNVEINIEPFVRFRNEIKTSMHSQPTGPIADAIKQWAFEYRSFIRRRFVRLSRSKGGGEWPDLAESTKRARRRSRLEQKQKKKGGRRKRRKITAEYLEGRSFAILRDTGLLFGALNPVFQSLPGQHEETIPGGVLVGYGGPGRHALKETAGDIVISRMPPTIAEIAAFHQFGGGRLPKREILVPPDEPTIRRMVRHIGNALAKIATSVGIGKR